MSKKGLKENQIFAARDTVEENDKIKAAREAVAARSEEHTSELQSR